MPPHKTLPQACTIMRTLPRMIPILLTALCLNQFSFAQSAPDDDAETLQTELVQLRRAIAAVDPVVRDKRLIADVEVFAKGVEWCLRHNEFYAGRKNSDAQSAWIGYCRNAIEIGNERLAELKAGSHPWTVSLGSTIRGYVSRVDGSIQPYAVSLPTAMNDAKSGQRFPLHVKLHGRGGTRNEVRFFNEHQNKPPQDDQDWIQLDVFGRTDNAYRWSGETDVFEAIADVNRRYRIDSHRITLWGFSMGGAGAWHLGLHHPSKWSSVGPGAGFVDFYQYQKQTEQRPPHQHLALGIYDSIDCALNMFNVPFCTYGGELDAQLVASTAMIDRGKELGVDAKLIVGPGVGHKFHPDSYKEFMAFHIAQSDLGRPRYPGRRNIRFVTRTLKYNRCEWLTIEEMIKPYKETLAEGGVGDDGVLRLKTKNIAALKIARDIAETIEIDGRQMALRTAADGLLPDVYYELSGDGWTQLEYDESVAFETNSELHKRHDLQGPIDDAFMESFVCVRGTGKPWSQETKDWSDWTLQRFAGEFDKWLRGRVHVVDDTAVTDDLIESSNLILFGDPGSNAVLAKVIDRLPVRWTGDAFEVNGLSFDPDTHGLSMIYPNPLNPRRYVVVNSGHTMHRKDFENSNSWLFPRLGDVAVQKFERQDSGYVETTVWAELFDSNWRLPVEKK
ncbi:MAG: prolyl oligopeptidase family serine peptidase [Planctomycetota bacterium]|nr:prolyl oligopeptidase family serine peptidase [Planctomycetota bacterium]